jgi:hypothetical protein
MTKLYRIVTNIGYGWDIVQWAPLFETKEEAEEWLLDDHGWDGRVDVEEIEVEEYEDEENE